MKLLILTQKVDKDDPILGFFHKWIEEFTKKFEKVSVICLEKGTYDLPNNVKIYSLGKESGKSKVKYIKNFFNLILGLHKEYDTVFVHMNPEYVVLGGIFWKILNKKIALWYTHRQSNLKLWLAEKMVNMVFTSSIQSFTLKSNKVSIVGHGIDTEFFKSIKRNINNNQKNFVHIGRITQIKNCEILIETAKIWKENWSVEFKIKFLGDTVLDKDIIYKKSLIDLIKKYNLEENFEFVGFVTPSEIASFYAEADASFNLAPTGGVDKSVIESIVAQIPTFASNQSFREIYGDSKVFFMFKELDPKDLAEKVMSYFDLPNSQREAILQKMSEEASEMFDVSILIGEIYSRFNEQTSRKKSL